jgi:hypothetical protein
LQTVDIEMTSVILYDGEMSGPQGQIGQPQ